MMTKNGRKISKNGQGGADFKAFVNVSLSEVDKKTIKDNLPDESVLLAWVADRCNDGYKFTIRWFDDWDCYNVAIYSHSPDNSDAGLGVSGKHSDLPTAIAATRHIFSTLMDDELKEELATQSQHNW